jgi:putative (di)nucleoside polyphosphate hydrolase
MPKKSKAQSYRPCAGIMLANRDGQIFVGKRIDNPGVDAWQMPQGGIDEGEDPHDAAIRELFEETGIPSQLVDILAQSAAEYYYDLPKELVGKIWNGKWLGQRQWWFLVRFKGEDSDINIALKNPEFSHWQWVDAAQLPQLIVPFKKRLYEQIVEEFAPLI